MASHLAQGACKEALLCAPIEWANDPQYVAQSCNAVGDREGRCLPGCLPEVKAQRKRVQQDRCGGGELCVPCFDQAGVSTGACNIGADPGPVAPARPFQTCCDALGTCVPKTALLQSVAAEDAARLGTDECNEPNNACVPTAWLDAPEIVLTICRAAPNLEGRCLPSCLPEVAARAQQLKQSGCRNGESCVPCHDPITGDDTKACALGGDSPREPAKRFEACCGGTSRCVPLNVLEDTVAAEDIARLGTDSCAGVLDVCVPTGWLERGEVQAARCSAVGGAEGRCLSTCLPQVQEQAQRLNRSDCQMNELCVPCYDPLSGEPTHACDLGKDPGPSEPPLRFDQCCNATAHCVPSDVLRGMVAPEDEAQLGADTCTLREARCVPDAWLSSGAPSARVCRSVMDNEGRCLSRCLPEVAAQADRLPVDSCAAEEVCAPCFDPLSGEPTAACAIGSDPGPVAAARVFEPCCKDSARCVPRTLLKDAGFERDLDRLAADSCSDASQVCVATDWLGSGPVKPSTCRAVGGGEGRCLSSCLPEVARQAQNLRQGSCEPQALCVPCFDPITGASTNACSIGADPGPSESPRVFPDCCGSGGKAQGRCVPRELVPPDQASGLPTGLCASAQDVCVPSALLQTPDTLSACTSTGALTGAQSAGVCLPSCFISRLQSSALAQSSCSVDQLCVPCSAVSALETDKCQ